MRIIRFSDLQSSPWKNGGGITREIAACRDGDRIHWRVSIADVAVDGPFSEFKGLTRILTVIEGSGLRLISPNNVINALYCQPAIFDGGLPVRSELINGKVRDLNVMFDASLYDAKVVVADAPLKYEAHNTTFIIGLAGTCTLNAGRKLHIFDVALLESQPIELTFSKSAAALVVRLNLRKQ